jgi:integrase
MVRKPSSTPSIYDIKFEPERKKPWLVRWYVFSKTPKRSFSTEAEAKDFHARLTIAKNDGMRFDPETCLPEAWTKTQTAQLCDLAHQWVQEQFPTWESKTRDSNVEVITHALLQFVKKPLARDSVEYRLLVSEIRDWLASPLDGPSKMKCPSWLRRQSLTTEQIDKRVCGTARTSLTKRLDGAVKAPTTIQRYVSTVGALFNWLIENKYFTNNPWKVEVKGRGRNANKVTTAVATHLLPTPAEARAEIEYSITQQRSKTKFHVLYYIMLFAGLRPGEARALRAEHCELPETGWGMLHVGKAAKSGTKRSTVDTPPVGPTKTGTTREVPITPELVKILRAHLAGRRTGLVVANNARTMVQDSNLSDAWARTRRTDLVLYDMRHICATAMIRSRMQPGTIAQRLGHSVEELFRTYAGEFAKLQLSGDDEFEELMASDREADEEAPE